MPHTFPRREIEKRLVQSLKWPLDDQHLSELSDCPPFFSSFTLIELWHWCCLPIWLSLSAWPHVACALPASPTVEPQTDIWNQDLHPRFLCGERCSTPKDHSGPSEVQNSSRRRSHKVELHKCSSCFLEVQTARHKYSNSSLNCDIFMFWQLLLRSPNFTKILLVPATNNWISPSCVLVLHLSKGGHGSSQTQQNFLGTVSQLGPINKRLTQSQLDYLWLRNTVCFLQRWTCSLVSFYLAQMCESGHKYVLWVQNKENICMATVQSSELLHQLEDLLWLQDNSFGNEDVWKTLLWSICQGI